MTSPALARNSGGRGGGRVYVWPPTGEEFVSVTNALDALPKPALKFWAAKVVAEWAYDHQDAWSRLDRPAAVDLLKREPMRFTYKKAGLGDQAHEYAERFARGEDLSVPADAELRPYVVALLRFLWDFRPEFHFIEATIFNRTHGYAGSFDFAAVLPEFPEYGLVLGDWKSGKSVYGEAGLQLNAYANAEFIATSDLEELAAPTFGAGLIVHLIPDGLTETLPDLGPGSYEAIPVPLTEEAFGGFLLAMQLRDLTKRIVPSLLGTPLRPRKEAAAA